MACDLQQLHEDYFAIDPITGQIVPTNTAASPSDSLVKVGASKEVTHTAVDSTAVTVDMKDFTANTLTAPTKPCGTALGSTTAKRELYTRWNDTTNEFEVYDEGQYVTDSINSAMCAIPNTAFTGTTIWDTRTVTYTNNTCLNAKVKPMSRCSFILYTPPGTRAIAGAEISDNGGATWINFDNEYQYSGGSDLQLRHIVQVTAHEYYNIPPGGSITILVRFFTTHNLGAALPTLISYCNDAALNYQSSM